MRSTLKKKTALVLILIAVLLSGTAITISSNVIANLIDNHYRAKALELAQTVTLITDLNSAKIIKNDIFDIYKGTEEKVTSEEWGSPAFDSYIERFSGIKRSRVFISLYNTLHYFQSTKNVSSVYLVFVDAENKHCVYMVDASDDPCPPGCIDPLGINEANLRVLENPEIGFPAYITNTEEYGWIVTAGVPMYDNTGKVFCYAMVDISMATVRAQQLHFVCLLLLIMGALTVIICIAAILVVNKAIIKPINELSVAAAQYCSKNKTNAHYQHSSFSELSIHTGDEIEALARSMQQMEYDINAHINTIWRTAKELSTTRRQASEMSALAYKDALTGVSNKTSYDKEIMRLNWSIADNNTDFGIAMIDLNFLKLINDTYGHENGNITIKKLCAVICRVFEHSPVFRIGGDEFAVVLKKQDFYNAGDLEAAFLRELDELQHDETLKPWEQVSAAIGIALFDKTQDDNAESVFKRADKRMYEHKKAMKADRT